LLSKSIWFWTKVKKFNTVEQKRLTVKLILERTIRCLRPLFHELIVVGISDIMGSCHEVIAQWLPLLVLISHYVDVVLLSRTLTAKYRLSLFLDNLLMRGQDIWILVHGRLFIFTNSCRLSGNTNVGISGLSSVLWNRRRLILGWVFLNYFKLTLNIGCLFCIHFPSVIIYL